MVRSAPKPAPKAKKARKPLKAKKWGVSSKPPSPLRKSGQTKVKRVKRYKSHLSSKFWQVLRCLIYQRDGGRCRDCGKHLESIHEMEAAHITNARFGNENLDDVKCSCADCNMAERQSRAWYAGKVA